jgi:hypothetical protein
MHVVVLSVLDKKMMTTTMKMMRGGIGKMRRREGREVMVMGRGGEAVATHTTIKY